MILKRLVIKNGSYTDRDGNEKARWLGIGQLHEHEGRQYITLDRHINLAAIPTRDGDTRVFVSLFDPDTERHGAKQDGQAQPQKPLPSNPKMFEADAPFEDEIPF